MGFFVLTAILVFIHNGISLWDQDEAAYAGFARTMICTGDWLIPHFFWAEAHRKPPLHFWDIALSFKVFGVSEFALRIPSALSVLFTYWLAFLAGRRIFGERQALIGAVVLATSLFVPVLAKVSVTDGTLLFFSTVCAFSLLYILEYRSWRWVAAFWISFALALLLKGPPIILFTGAMGVLLFIFHPNRRNLIILHPRFFMPLAFIPLLLWGYLAWQRDPGFIRWMIDWYILKRVNGSVFGQTGPPGMHILLITVFFIPWFLVLPFALRKGITGLFTKNRQFVMLGAWFIAGWLIYEFSPSKLPTYVIAAHVPLAIACGIALNEVFEGRMRIHAAFRFFQGLLPCILAAAFAAAPFVLHLSMPLRIAFTTFGLIYGLLMLFSVFTHDEKKLVARLIGTNLFFQFGLWAVLISMADQLKNSTRQVGRYLDAQLPKNSVVYIGNDEGHPPSLPFYIAQNHQVAEQYNSDSLLALYRQNKPTGFVLRKEQADFLKSRQPDLIFRVFHQQFTDRTEAADYYVLIKK